MTEVTLYYAKGLRDAHNPDQPLPAIREAVMKMNRDYALAGVDLSFTVSDLEQFLMSFTMEKLQEIAGSDGTRRELVDLIQEPQSFEAYLRDHGIYEKDGQFYQKKEDGDRLLEEINIADRSLTYDPVRYRFVKSIDPLEFFESFDPWDMDDLVLDLDDADPQPAPSHKDSNSEENLKIAKRWLNDKGFLRDGAVNGDIMELLSEKFVHGDIGFFQTFLDSMHKSVGFMSGNLNLIDRCAMYVNSASDDVEREWRANYFLESLDQFRTCFTNLLRVKPNPYYEAGHFPFVRSISTLLNCICLFDKSNFYVNDDSMGHTEIYRLLRYPNTPYFIGIGRDPDERAIREVVLHEMAHMYTNPRAKDIPEFDSPGDGRLMLAPVHFIHPRTGKLGFSEEKISVASIKEAYNVQE